MGKILFISGTQHIIGKTIAEQAANEGHKLILLARDESEIMEISELITDAGADFLPLIADMTDTESARHAIELVLSKFDRIDAYINTHFVLFNRNLWELETVEFERMWKTNTLAVFNTLKFMVPHFIENKSGDVITVMPRAAKSGISKYSGFNSSMFALRGLLLGLSQELNGSGVRIMNIFTKLSQSDKGIEDIDLEKLPLKPADVTQIVLNALMLHKRAIISEMDILPTEIS